MATLDPAILAWALAGLVAGVAGGWLLGQSSARRATDDVRERGRARLEELAFERDRLAAETAKQRERLEEQEGRLHRGEQAVARYRTALESAAEREKNLKKDIFTLRGEREDFKDRIAQFQAALGKVKQQAIDLQTEFAKSREFYKGQLRKAFEKRKDLESRLDNARAEHASFTNLLASSRTEQEAINRMLTSAQNRLADMDELEHEVIRLEAENAQLNQDARLAQREIESLRRDIAELEELKVQNRELAHCLESMEASRRQHESDARRYREQAHETEKRSETLEIRLDEVEKHFAEIESQHRKALREARNGSGNGNGAAPAPREVDDLKEIVGIGKVFERALNDLGVYSFRQIAAFGPADVARINRELKELRGRLEQDDWIGQARELLYRKYGAAEAG